MFLPYWYIWLLNYSWLGRTPIMASVCFGILCRLLDWDFAYLAMKACSYHDLPSVLNQYCQVNRHLYSQIWRRFSLKLPFLQPLNRETILMVILHLCSLWNVKCQTCTIMWCVRVPIDPHLNLFRLSRTFVACLTPKMKHRPLFK